MKYRTVEVDLTAYDNGKPHWLSPRGMRPDIFARNRAKHRGLAEAAQKMEKLTARMDAHLKDKAK